MIDDAAIDRVSEECNIPLLVSADRSRAAMLNFAKRIYQLGSSSQFKNVHSVTQYGDFEVRVVFSSVRSASEFRQAVEQQK
ncbi:MAG TPA: hypothetical protein VIY48_03070 [Candidatus Paceibacterota bacterium]